MLNPLPTLAVGFLSFVCRPFYAAVQRVLPDEHSAAALERIDTNLAEWSAYNGNAPPAAKSPKDLDA